MRKLTIFLQVALVFIGIITVAFMLWEPNIEGRNVNSTLFEVYFKDPFLAFTYIASTPFFFGLFQVFKVLKNVRRDNIFSEVNVKAMQTIKRCATFIICFALIGEIVIFSNTSDDRAGGVAIGLFIILGSIMTAVVSAMFEKILRDAIIKNATRNLTNN